MRETAARKRPEIALVSAGTGYDLGPSGPALLAGYADRVHAVLRAAPPAHAAAVLHAAIVGLERVRQVTGQSWPTWQELMQSSGWNDHEGYEAERAAAPPRAR